MGPYSVDIEPSRPARGLNGCSRFQKWRRSSPGLNSTNAKSMVRIKHTLFSRKAMMPRQFRKELPRLFTMGCQDIMESIDRRTLGIRDRVCRSNWERAITESSFPTPETFSPLQVASKPFCLFSMLDASPSSRFIGLRPGPVRGLLQNHIRTKGGPNRRTRGSESPGQTLVQTAKRGHEWIMSFCRAHPRDCAPNGSKHRTKYQVEATFWTKPCNCPPTCPSRPGPFRVTVSGSWGATLGSTVWVALFPYPLFPSLLVLSYSPAEPSNAQSPCWRLQPAQHSWFVG